MRTSEPSASSPTGARNSAEARDIGSSPSHSPTHADSALSSSLTSNLSRSSLASQKNAQAQRSQSQRPVDESTRIFDRAGASLRGYQATETPNPVGQASGQIEGAQRSANTGNGSNYQSTQAPQVESPVGRQSWYGRFVDRFGSLELENKGSVARDHLALERTFLAWMRTSLAFASIGIAVTQLFRLNSATASTKIHSFDGHDQPAILPPLLYPSLLDNLSTVSTSSASSRLRSVGKPLGSTFIGVAILILIIGFHRYFESQYWIIRGKFPASRGSIALTAFVAAALIIAALAVILAVSPGAIER